MAIAANGNQTFFPIPQPQYNAAVTLVVAAQTAWAQLNTQFLAESLAMGITQNPVAAQLISAALLPVSVQGNSGSLIGAFNALSAVQITPAMAPFLTEARILYMKNELINIMATV